MAIRGVCSHTDFMSNLSSVESARYDLGRRLRTLRETKGLTARSLAKQAGWHESKCSRIENGHMQPSDADIATWAKLCDAESQTKGLLDTAHGIHVMHSEWRQMEKEGLARAQSAVLPRWEEARVFKAYAQCLVPGPLQTEEYTRLLLTSVHQRRQIRGGGRNGAGDIEAALRIRLRKQDLLMDQDRTFHVVVEEAALRHHIGNRQTMTEQLARLLQVSGLPTVRLGVVPQAANRTALWPVEDFWMFDDKQVHVELVSAFLQVTQPSEIKLYRQAFDELAAQAAYDQQATLIIASALTDLARS